MRKSRVSTMASVLVLGLFAVAGTTASAGNLINHGGPVITAAHVVFLFWGPSFSTGGADHTYATTLQTYRNQLGTGGHYSVLGEYCGSNGCIALTNLAAGTPDFFDTSTPPAKVTDALVQGEVNKYLQTHTKDDNTIYMVLLPSTSYSDDGSGATSCGGPNLAYCSYHSWIGSGTTATKYTIQPYPSCSGCQVAGFSGVQNQEVFVQHETANTVTDPTRTTWYDSAGNEVASKCFWSPTPPYLSGGYAYQHLWSNRTGSCV